MTGPAHTCGNPANRARQKTPRSCNARPLVQIPRYGWWSGPGWGQPNLEALGYWYGPYSRQNVIEYATYWHDQYARNPGADRQLIHDVWSRNDLGPYGQVYRVGLTAMFGTGIALGMDD